MSVRSFLRPAHWVPAVGLFLISTTTIAAPVRFAIIGDRTSDAEPGIYEQVVVEAARLKPDFAISVGDGIDGYTEDSIALKEQWTEYLAMMTPLDCPIHYTAGNHDIQGAVSDRVFRQMVGDPNCSFAYQDVWFIVLDNSRFDRSEEFGPEQMHWLEEQLKFREDAQSLIVFMHKPFWYNSTALGKPDTLHTLFVEYGVDAVFTGHFHSYFAAEYDGIKYISIGSSGGGYSPNRPGPGYHFAWVTIDDGDIDVAPITFGSVLAWDVAKPEEVIISSQIEHGSISFVEPLRIMDRSNRIAGPTSMTVTNLTNNHSWSDTLRWIMPEGWAISPSEVALNIPPGEIDTLEFQVEATGPLYPLPTLELSVPYAETDTCHLSQDLGINRIALAARTMEPIQLDGELNEGFWTRPVEGHFDYDGSPLMSDSTRIYYAYDEENLYIGAICLEPDMETITATVSDPDGPVYGDDCVGFLIQPNLGILAGYQIYINSLGTIYDQRLWAKEDNYFTSDSQWDCELEVSANRHTEHWSFELKIPLAQFGVSEISGKEFGLNFRRKMQSSGAAAHFQVPWSYDVASYGRLVFR